MKKIKFIATIILGLSSFQSYSQVYERIFEISSVEVQEKIDENKRAGIDILTNIKGSQILGVSGLNNSNKALFENALTSNSKVTSYSINNELNSVSIESSAWLTKDELDQMFSSLSLIMTGYTVSYSINEQ